MTTEYRGEHSAPTKFETPLHDLISGFSDDIYRSDAAKIFGMYGGDGLDNEAIGIMQRCRNKPNRAITVYRAIPNVLSNQQKINKYEKMKAAYFRRGRVPAEFAGKFNHRSDYFEYLCQEVEKLEKLPPQNFEKMKINVGDWVTIVKGYAKIHGKNELKNDFKIITKTVLAKELFTDGNSIHEWGYDK